MKHSLEHYIGIFKDTSSYVVRQRCEKIDRLWVGESPAVLAYYRLKGIRVTHGILNVNTVEINGKDLLCSGSRETLMDLRVDCPEVTKEEFLEMLE